MLVYTMSSETSFLSFELAQRIGFDFETFLTCGDQAEQSAQPGPHRVYDRQRLLDADPGGLRVDAAQLHRRVDVLDVLLLHRREILQT